MKAILKVLLALAMFALGQMAWPAPTLYADPYPATGVQPAAAVFSINGGTPIACTLVAVSGGLQPQCDLVSIVTPGTYTLVMTVSTVAGCTGNACTGPGSASSAPFSYQWLGSVVPGPVLHIKP
jgi:hypothetical protein